MRQWLFITFSLLFVSACSPTSLINAFVSPELERRGDIAYGPLARHRLDVYQTAEAPQGVVVFVHGGTWDSGDKSDYPFIADTLTENGYITVIINYRLVPDITFPRYAEDLALALHWVTEHSDLLGSERLFLMGHSAGAHIAALVTFDETYLAPYGDTELAGFIGLAGPYDFLPPEPDALRTRAALGPESNWQATQPINFVDGSEAPALLLTGLDDTTVNPGNSERMASKILEQGGQVSLISYEGVDHAGIVGALARVARFLEPNVLDDVLAFLSP